MADFGALCADSALQCVFNNEPGWKKRLLREWRQVVTKLGRERDAPVTEAGFRRMHRCRVAGERGTGRIHTCRRNKLCPWCYSRHLQEHLSRLSPFLPGNRIGATMSVFFGSGSVPLEAEMRQAAYAFRAESLRETFHAAIAFWRFCEDPQTSHIGLAATVIGVLNRPFAEHDVYDSTEDFLEDACRWLAYPRFLLRQDAAVINHCLGLSRYCRTAGWGAVRKTKEEKNCEFCIYQRHTPENFHVD